MPGAAVGSYARRVALLTRARVGETVVAVGHPSAQFSATLRVRLANRPGAFAVLASTIAEEEGLLDAIDLVRAESGTKVRDVTVLAVDAQHMTRIVDSVRRLDGIEVEQVSDRTLLLHLGGKLEIVAKAPLKTRDDLSMAYTPGVARVSRAIAADPADVWNLTIKQNTVAVVSDGTAVLGLGDIGPAAALPVMEERPSCSRSSAASTRSRSASTRRTRTKSCAPCVRWRRCSAGSTSRTSPRLAASRSSGGCARRSTSRSSTMTSTGPRSSCSPAC